MEARLHRQHRRSTRRPDLADMPGGWRTVVPVLGDDGVSETAVHRPVQVDRAQPARIRRVPDGTWAARPDIARRRAQEMDSWWPMLSGWTPLAVAPGRRQRSRPSFNGRGIGCSKKVWPLLRPLAVACVRAGLTTARSWRAFTREAPIRCAASDCASSPPCCWSRWTPGGRRSRCRFRSAAMASSKGAPRYAQ
jgi:hypothetical protein